MPRLSIIALIAIVCAASVGVLVSNPAESQSAGNFVALQAASPGATQSGNSNISGSMIAGQFQGGGAGITGVNADLLDGIDSTAFGRLASGNVWTGINTFGNAGNSFTGSGTGLTGVNADLLDGINSTAFLQSIPVPLTLSGVGATHIIRGENTSSSPDARGGHFLSASTSGRGVEGEATAGTGNSFGGYFLNQSNQGIGAFGIAYGSAGRGVVGSTVSITGPNTGVEGLSRGSSGAAGVRGYAYGEEGATYGGDFTSDSGSGTGVRGRAPASTGTTYGGWFESASTTGRGVFGRATAATGFNYGVEGNSASTSGAGVYGTATAATGANYGVYGSSNSTTGFGVFGRATAATGVNYGTRGESDSTGGYGVLGIVNATSGTNYGVHGHSRSTSGYGVHGLTSAATGTTYGVYGQSASPAGYGVYSNGNTGASGTKSFRIDHPFDPTGKYLLHYAAESPMPQNFYVGNVVTDSKGYAWVELPDYFEEINTNFKYQLTIVDDADTDGFVMAKISKEIRANRFQIRTSAPRVKVSWEIKADRNDLYVRANKPKDVVEKEDLERGTYQRPELYGEPAEKGVNYRPADPGSR